MPGWSKLHCCKQFLYLCSSSSRCARVLVRWERSSFVSGRAQQRHRAGVGSQRSWGPAGSWICAGCFLLLALLSTARQELLLFKIRNIKQLTMHLTVLLFPFHSAELQLKTRHQPYKLCRQWQDLLYRFTDASEEDILQGETLVFNLNQSAGALLLGFAFFLVTVCPSKKWAVGMTQVASPFFLWLIDPWSAETWLCDNAFLENGWNEIKICCSFTADSNVFTGSHKLQ